jgi:O-antigen/teichoic acid export membrane protein
MSTATRILKNTGILYLRMGVTVFISLYATRLVLLALGAKDFGIFNLVGGLIAMLGFLNASMAETTQRYISYSQGSGDKEQTNIIFNVSISLHLVIALFLVVFLEIMGYIFLNNVLNIDPDRLPAAKLVFQCMIASTFFTILSAPYDAVINARENSALFAVLGIIESLLKLGIALFVVNTDEDKLIIYSALTAAVAIALLIARVVYCSGKYEECKLNLITKHDRSIMKNMSGFAGWSFLGFSASMVTNYGQGVVFNIFFGTAINASQGIANQISGQLGAVAHTLLKALNPTITKSEGGGDRTLMLKAAMLGSKVSFFLLTLIYVSILIEMPFILSTWLSNVPPYTVVFCQLLLIRNLIEQLFIPVVTAISAVGNIRRYQISSALITLFPLAFTYWLFSMGYPPFALYIVFIIYSVIASANILYHAEKTCQLPRMKFLKEVIVPCLVLAVTALCLSSIPHFLMQEGFARLVSVAAFSITLICSLIWMIGLNANERSMARNLVAMIIQSAQTKFKFRLN